MVVTTTLAWHLTHTLSHQAVTSSWGSIEVIIQTDAGRPYPETRTGGVYLGHPFLIVTYQIHNMVSLLYITFTYPVSQTISPVTSKDLDTHNYAPVQLSASMSQLCNISYVQYLVFTLSSGEYIVFLLLVFFCIWTLIIITEGCPQTTVSCWTVEMTNVTCQPYHWDWHMCRASQN